MRVIAIEEQFPIEDLLENRANYGDQPADAGAARIADMDSHGIDLQVLGTWAPGVQHLDPAMAVDTARRVNDSLVGAIAAYPDRFAGFATVAPQDAKAAAVELERAVKELGFKGTMIHGQTQGRFLDEEEFWPIFEAAEGLDVPIYLHPTYPPEAVRKAYFYGLPDAIASSLSMGAWGWHCETGLHVLRIVASGVFERFPRLQIVVGHMGENLPFSFARADRALSRAASNLPKTVGEYLRENVYITTSGYFTFPPLLCALMVFGADRIMFAVDFPFGDNGEARRFLDSAPVSPADREKIAHANAERLLRL